KLPGRLVDQPRCRNDTCTTRTGSIGLTRVNPWATLDARTCGSRRPALESSRAGSSRHRPTGKMSAVVYNGMSIVSLLPATAPWQVLSTTVFSLAGITMFYALFGYPLLLGWMAKRANNPVHKDDKLRTVSFVIAVYNGEKFLERKLKTILSLNYPPELMDILVVSDGSTDRTDEIARSFADQGVRFLR